MRKTWIWLAAMVILAAATPAAAATDKTCLTGGDPVVAGDLAQIVALAAAVDEACPCASFDGSAGRTHSKYVRCAALQVKAAVTAGALRRHCKGRVVASFRGTACGYAAEREAVPCVERNAGGKVRCSIRPAADCRDQPGRFTRTACSSYRSCVDAGDTNADYKVDANDSGVCVPLPTETPTLTATPTLTPTPSDTPTIEPTSTPPSTPTATPTGTSTPSGTPTCGSEPPRVAIVVNENTDTEEDATLPPQAIGICPSQTPSGGGCQLLNVLDGSLEVFNFFDASDSFDPRACGQDPQGLSYRWEILFPPTLQGGNYTSNGITGYLTDKLTIAPSSLPSLDDTDAGADTWWRVRLTVTSLQPPITQTVVFFRFKYQQSELTLQVSTDCQLLGHFDPELCPSNVAMNGLPTSEPH